MSVVCVCVCVRGGIMYVKCVFAHVWLCIYVPLREGGKEKEVRADGMSGHLCNSHTECSMLQGRQPPIPGFCCSAGPVQT